MTDRRTIKRSPVTIGFIGILILLMLSTSAFFLQSLPLIGAGITYKADFSEAAGLQSGAEVRVAGVKVGNVRKVELKGDRVRVDMQVDQAWIGNQTSASIQIKTVLGQKYIALDPAGNELADPKQVIPLERTTSPYDVIEAFSDAAEQVEELDTNQLATSMRTLSDAFSGTPADLRSSLDGLTRLSETIASRDQKVQELLAATADTSKLLADRNQEFERLISGAGELLGELNNRQQAISVLLSSTITLSDTLTGIVKDNQEQIGPTLETLRQVIEILNDQNENLRQSLTYMAPFYRLYANVLGSGRWFDSVVTNLLPPALPQQNTTRFPVQQEQLPNGGGTVAGQ
ncbi:phospholipid/cholesterol/gamma-HCH transport system substrate-binding protein [Williamsia limnetica]|jgi:phospholipid/cholesterol/gamma-HCH transport system substrate-binding protein|uniref:Phospholipid/cholesterol/gamma-HCH transport system substrate-binding protein n=1 Tax=Williamsia limnetica TaxID=882452 RepID=A0A318RNU1_WILLI|nr:MCE family protein [Williamsia limnetica]PYE20274.1 phospholipid/cholesterol/gamma-HCH transport system substrate-binding protein [Williamsia limnetica]